MKQPLQAGIDIVHLESPHHKSKKTGFVTNNVAQTTAGVPSRQHLLQQGFNLVQLFSPEHGITAAGEDGAPQQNEMDALTQLPVISLYGENMKPPVSSLQEIECMLFDIPDVGCRFYTYLWTLTYIMEACAENGIPLIVLDRPNPIGGDLAKAEGPWLDEVQCGSFIGRWSIPVRHCCTLGELAGYFAATRVPGLDLKIIKVQNWNRHTDTLTGGWPFRPTSPAIVDAPTALLYPGTGLLEGIYVNEGRGTNHPFSRLGAPWINGAALCSAFNAIGLEGVAAKAVNYVPEAGIYAGAICEGVQLCVTDAARVRPVAMGIRLIQLLMAMYPREITNRKYYTAANPSGDKHMDKLLGVPDAFEKLRTQQTFDTNLAAQWEKIMQPWLLY